MQSNPLVAIDLPIKVLAWQEDDNVFLSYLRPSDLAERHNIVDKNEIIEKMTQALDKLTNYATSE